VSPEQCRAARGWLDWSQNMLAIRAGVALSTVRDFEKRRHVPTPSNLHAMCQALEREGVFFPPDGVIRPQRLAAG
jgi:DNA-binding transcriptional regulator YiaG